MSGGCSYLGSGVKRVERTFLDSSSLIAAGRKSKIEKERYQRGQGKRTSR